MIPDKPRNTTTNAYVRDLLGRLQFAFEGASQNTFKSACPKTKNCDWTSRDTRFEHVDSVLVSFLGIHRKTIVEGLIGNWLLSPCVTDANLYCQGILTRNQ